MKRELWCEECKSFHYYKIIQTEQTHFFKHHTFVLYDDKIAICGNCGHLVFHEDLEDERLVRLALLFERRTGQIVLM